MDNLGLEALPQEDPVSLSLAFDHLTSGVVVEDAGGGIVFANRAMFALMGMADVPDGATEANFGAVAAGLRRCSVDPGVFVRRADELRRACARVSNEDVPLADGRWFRRDFAPISSGGRCRGFVWQYSDVTEATNRRRELVASEKKYRRVITNLNLGLLEVDLDERIRYVNEGFCSISGYAEAELVGRIPSELFRLDGDGLTMLREKNRSRINDVADAYEVPLTVKNGAKRWWSISGAPSYGEDGKVVGSIGIHVDITPQKTLELELREAKLRAEHSVRAGESFLASMSHEIRTPLSGIYGMTQLLQDTELNPEQLEYVGTIDKAIGVLQTVIDDILDLSKINAGMVVLHAVEFSLREELESLYRLNCPRAQRKGIALSLRFRDEGLAERYNGDAHRLAQIVANLLGNALKFTEQGGVSLECGLAGSQGGKDLVEIAVTDTGIGMDKDFLPSLFDPFTQEHGGHARKFGGTGLGMNISQKLVRLMGGDIEVSSEKHRGTVFRVRLPLERRARSVAVPLPAAEPGTLHGRRILVAEDNEMNAAVVRNMLAKEGAEVVLVANGNQLVAEAANRRFDLVISDLEMPIMGGIEAVRWIRAHLPRGLRVIALTANVLPEEKQRSLDAGFDDVIYKPFRRDVLLAACRAHLARNGGDDAASGRGNPAAPYDLAEIRELLDGDEAELGEVIRIFLEETPGKLAEIIPAMEAGDATKVRRIVHYLESSIRHLGVRSADEALGKIRGDGGPVSIADLEPAVRTLVAVVETAMRGLEAEFPAVVG
ncbi:MAG: hypothetical protein RIS76_1513 [Verrucomicrobiota bacterium]